VWVLIRVFFLVLYWLASELHFPDLGVLISLGYDDSLVIYLATKIISYASWVPSLSIELRKMEQKAEK
jgi:hypothetical protein